LQVIDFEISVTQSDYNNYNRGLDNLFNGELTSDMKLIIDENHLAYANFKENFVYSEKEDE
jgi:hypothetical protein